MISRIALASLALVLAQSSVALAASEELVCSFGTETKKVYVIDGKPTEIDEVSLDTQHVPLGSDGVTRARAQNGDYVYRVTLFNGYLRGLIMNTKTKQVAFGLSRTEVKSNELTHAYVIVELNPLESMELDDAEFTAKVGDVSATLSCQVETLETSK